ncbi:MAG: 4Fe-4S dicluster domain-containing protein [Desulfurococcaceae archaeon]
MVTHIIVDLSKCSGCRYCEVWCSFSHEKVFSTSMSRIRVIKDDLIGMDHPVVCRHCLDAPCLSACGTDALYRDIDGHVKLNKEKCIKCGSCIIACPYGAIFQNPLDNTPLICDLCGGNPVCVAKCPTNALSIYPLGEISLKDPARLGKRYLRALNEYEKLLARWGVYVGIE